MLSSIKLLSLSFTDLLSCCSPFCMRYLCYLSALDLQGPLCSLCKPRFYFDSNTKTCKSCKGQGSSQLILMVIIPVLLVILVAVATFGFLSADEDSSLKKMLNPDALMAAAEGEMEEAMDAAEGELEEEVDEEQMERALAEMRAAEAGRSKGSKKTGVYTFFAEQQRKGLLSRARMPWGGTRAAPPKAAKIAGKMMEEAENNEVDLESNFGPMGSVGMAFDDPVVAAIEDGKDDDHDGLQGTGRAPLFFAATRTSARAVEQQQVGKVGAGTVAESVGSGNGGGSYKGSGSNDGNGSINGSGGDNAAAAKEGMQGDEDDPEEAPRERLVDKLKKRLQPEDGEEEDLDDLANQLVDALSSRRINLFTYRIMKRLAKGKLLKKIQEKERLKAWQAKLVADRREKEKNMTWSEYLSSKVDIKNIMPKVKIMTTVFQIISGFPGSLSLNFPGGSGSIFKAMGVVNFGGLSIGSPQCFTSYDYIDTMITSTLTPIGVICALMTGFIVHMFFLNRDRKDPQAIRAVTGQYINFFFLITYLVLPSVTTTCFGAFTCKNIDPDGLMPGTPTYLRLDMSIACNTPRYRFGVMWAIAMIIVYPIGILSFYYFVLRYNRDDIIAAHRLTDVEGEEEAAVSHTAEGENTDPAEQPASVPAPVNKDTMKGLSTVGTVALSSDRLQSTDEHGHEHGHENGFKAPLNADPFELDEEGWQVDHTVVKQRVRWDEVRMESHPEDDERHARLLARRAAGDPVVENREELDYEYQISQRKGLMKYITEKELQFLHKSYEGGVWYWEVIETGRRLMLTAVVSVVEPGDNPQIVFGIFIALVYMKLYAYCQPFVRYEDDVLQEMAQYQIFFTLFIALLLKLEALPGQYYQLGLDFMLVIVNISTTLATVLFVLKFHEMLEARGAYAVKKEAERKRIESLRKQREAEEKSASQLPRYQDALTAGERLREQKFHEALWQNQWPDQQPAEETFLGVMNKRQRDLVSIELPFPREFEHHDALGPSKGTYSGPGGGWPSLSLWSEPDNESSSSSGGGTRGGPGPSRSSRNGNIGQQHQVPGAGAGAGAGAGGGPGAGAGEEKRSGWTDVLQGITPFKL